MEILSQEKQRAFNIIWNAAGDYSFQPAFATYDARGKAELYWNFIVGAVQHYYDPTRLNEFFASLQKDPNHEFYEDLSWIALEHNVFQMGVADRPVLEDLRRFYAEKVLRQEDVDSFYFLIHELKNAHFRRVLGQEPLLDERAALILSALEWDAAADTEQMIEHLQTLINDFFPLAPAAKRKWSIFDLCPIQINLRFGNRVFPGLQQLWNGLSFLNFFSNQPGDSSEVVHTTEKGKPHAANQITWHHFTQAVQKKQREHIQARYGVSILPEAQMLSLERTLCVGNHQNCRLHLTRGEFDDTARPDTMRQKALTTQREKNQHFYQKHLVKNRNHIVRLSNRIKNAMLANLEPSVYRADTGQLLAGRIWREIHLQDSKIFLKTTRDHQKEISIDILLDASGSQMNRQEMISTEAFIIAESLNRCAIPVRVLSFCTNERFTILNLYRDYHETNQNERIFSYHASGCNRDGLALRTALHLMKNSAYDHKVLIVLSDGKPIDPQGIAAGGSNPDLNFYADAAGVNDAAFEVRKGRQSGVSILGVFSGLNEDIPAAQRIYGNGLVCIHSLEKFVDIVGMLIKNELKNL